MSLASDKALAKALAEAGGDRWPNSTSRATSLPSQRSELNISSSHRRFAAGRRQGPAQLSPSFTVNGPSSLTRNSEP